MSAAAQPDGLPQSLEDLVDEFVALKQRTREPSSRIRQISAALRKRLARREPDRQRYTTRQGRCVRLATRTRREVALTRLEGDAARDDALRALLNVLQQRGYIREREEQRLIDNS